MKLYKKSKVKFFFNRSSSVLHIFLSTRHINYITIILTFILSYHPTQLYFHYKLLCNSFYLNTTESSDDDDDDDE